jgi:hypothetical protein
MEGKTKYGPPHLFQHFPQVTSIPHITYTPHTYHIPSTNIPTNIIRPVIFCGGYGLWRTMGIMGFV